MQEMYIRIFMYFYVLISINYELSTDSFKHDIGQNFLLLYMCKNSLIRSEKETIIYYYILL